MLIGVALLLCQPYLALSEIPIYNAYYGKEFIKLSRQLRPHNIFLESMFDDLDLLNKSANRCRDHLNEYKENINRDNTSWPMYYVDSSGITLGSGWLTGNTVNFGDFDECVSQINSEFRGNYCWLKIEPQGERPHRSSYVPNNNPLVFTLCVPDSCEPEDLEVTTSRLAKQLNFSVTAVCQTARPSLSAYDTVVILFFTLVGLFTLSTLIPKERLPISHEGFLNVWQCFDINKNMKTLAPSNSDTNILASLYGIRFFSQSSLLWFHVVIIGLVGHNPVQNKFFFNDFYRSWAGAVETELVLAVDTFFMMSGVLLTYNCLKRKTDLDLPKYYIHRYLRLTPPLLAALLFVQSFCNKLCNGPLCLLEIDKEREACGRYWWTNLLYINNFYPGILGSCMPHTWYLAADWQLFMVLSPIVIVVVNRWPQHIVKIIAAIHLSSLISSFTVAFVFNIDVDNFFFNSKYETEIYFNRLYTTPFSRAGPWALGMFLGVFLHEFKKKPMKLSTFQIVFGWCTCFLVLCGSALLDMAFLQEDSQPALWLRAIFITLQRNFFVLAVGWIIFSCAANIAGPLGTFLTSPVFEPLGKLTYCMYLIHKSILSIYAGEKRSSTYYSTVSQLPPIIGLVVMSTLAAFLLYITFEAPFMHLEKLIFKKGNSCNISPTSQTESADEYPRANGQQYLDTSSAN